MPININGDGTISGLVDPIAANEAVREGYLSAGNVSFSSTGLFVVTGTDVQAALEATDAALEDRMTTQEVKDYATAGVVELVARTENTDEVDDTEIVADTITFTAEAGRRYRLSWQGLLRNSGSSALIARIRFREGTTVTGTALYTSDTTINSGSAGNLQTGSAVVYTIPGAASITYALTLQRNFGSGTCRIHAGSTFPAMFVVEDVGSV